MSDLATINQNYGTWAAQQGPGGVNVNSEGFRGFENQIVNQIGAINDPAVLAQQLQQQQARLNDPTYGGSAQNIINAIKARQSALQPGQGFGQINQEYGTWAGGQGGNVDVNSQGFQGFEGRILNEIGATNDLGTLQQQLAQQQSRVNDPVYGASAQRMVQAIQSQMARVQGGQGPMTGLQGYEQALQGGAAAGINALQQGYGQSQAVLNDMSKVNAALAPYQETGGKAFDLQAALSGSLGPEAQQAAFANYKGSPGQQFLRDKAEQALLRNSAALGGLGGGRVRQELQRQAIGEAEQSFGNDFNRIGQVAGVGANAAGAVAGYGNQRDLAIGQNAMTTGANAANLLYGTGQQVAKGRFDTGVNLSNAISNTTSALAQLANQGGQNASTTMGTGAGNLSQLLAAAGSGDAASKQALATLINNILLGQGSSVGGLAGIPGIQNQDGIIGGVGNALAGAGALVTSLNPPKDE